MVTDIVSNCTQATIIVQQPDAHHLKNQRAHGGLQEECCHSSTDPHECCDNGVCDQLQIPGDPHLSRPFLDNQLLQPGQQGSPADFILEDSEVKPSLIRNPSELLSTAAAPFRASLPTVSQSCTGSALSLTRKQCRGGWKPSSALLGLHFLPLATSTGSFSVLSQDYTISTSWCQISLLSHLFPSFLLQFWSHFRQYLFIPPSELAISQACLAIWQYMFQACWSPKQCTSWDLSKCWMFTGVGKIIYVAQTPPRDQDSLLSLIFCTSVLKLSSIFISYLSSATLKKTCCNLIFYERSCTCLNEYITASMCYSLWYIIITHPLTSHHMFLVPCLMDFDLDFYTWWPMATSRAKKLCFIEEVDSSWGTVNYFVLTPCQIFYPRVKPKFASEVIQGNSVECKM